MSRLSGLGPVFGGSRSPQISERLVRTYVYILRPKDTFGSVVACLEKLRVPGFFLLLKERIVVRKGTAKICLRGNASHMREFLMDANVKEVIVT